MPTLLQIGCANVILATGFAILALLFTRIWKHPQFAHLLWLIVLLKFITPPLFHVPVPVFPKLSPTFFIPTTAALHTTSEERVSAVNDAVSPGPVSGTSTQSNKASKLIAPRVSATLAPMSMMSLVSTLWLVGSLLWLGVFVKRVLTFRRSIVEAAPATIQLQGFAATIATQIGLRRCPDLRVTDRPVGPLVWPLSRGAVILLPNRLMGKLSTQEIRGVLVRWRGGFDIVYSKPKNCAVMSRFFGRFLRFLMRMAKRFFG
ncbi:MAG: hypothetical protein MPJ50_18390 [Pirellulales bacterium]|nr:hypothetical protein [Pirellulales bacterium]